MSPAKLRLGVVCPETWDFFHDLFGYFRSKYEVSLFQAPTSNLPVFRGRFEKRLLDRALSRLTQTSDVVFFEWASDLLARATSLPKQARIVTRLHRWELYKWADEVCWEAVDRVILVSEAKRTEFVERFPRQAQKICVIPESINLDRFPFVRRDFAGTIGILCHIGPRKRVYELVLACSELLRRNPSLRLHIGGDVHPAHGDYYAALRSLVRRMSLEANVVFDGHVKNPPEWYRKIDVFVSHSYSEGLQVSPIEAMASGCYTIAHRWEGADELLPADCLYFTDREMLDKIESFCRLGEDGRQAQRARMRNLAATRFDIAANQLKIGAILDSVASENYAFQSRF